MIQRLYPQPSPPTCGLLLTGGGARSAYQAGVMRYIGETFPQAKFPILTGLSAGAMNASILANHTGSLDAATDHLVDSWGKLDFERVVAVESGLSILWSMLWRRSVMGEMPDAAEVRRSQGLLDTSPLWSFLQQQMRAPNGVLTGVEENLQAGHLKAVAVITTNYATGQTVSFVQGSDFDVWERPERIGRHATLTVDHVMASSSLPLVFPAVQIGDAWYGDGGIRLSAPLAPAVHLGADRILVISNNHRPSREEADEPVVKGYPPTAQIIGTLTSAIFSDALEQDALTLERVNTLVEELPRNRRHGMRPVKLLQIYPSKDLGRIAVDYQDRLPSSLRFLTTGLGTDRTDAPMWLSVLLFDPEFVQRLLELGYEDAYNRHDEIAEFLRGTPARDGETVELNDVSAPQPQPELSSRPDPEARVAQTEQTNGQA